MTTDERVVIRVLQFVSIVLYALGILTFLVLGLPVSGGINLILAFIANQAAKRIQH